MYPPWLQILHLSYTTSVQSIHKLYTCTRVLVVHNVYKLYTCPTLPVYSVHKSYTCTSLHIRSPCTYCTLVWHKGSISPPLTLGTPTGSPTTAKLGLSNSPLHHYLWTLFTFALLDLPIPILIMVGWELLVYIRQQSCCHTLRIWLHQSVPITHTMLPQPQEWQWATWFSPRTMLGGGNKDCAPFSVKITRHVLGHAPKKSSWTRTKQHQWSRCPPRRYSNQG